MIYINNQPIQTKDAAITKSISGDFILTFTTYDSPGNAVFHNIVEDSVIFANGYEFIVKQLQDTKNKKTVVAPSIFYANADVFNDSIYGGTRTFSEFATHALKGTGWSFTADFGEEKRIIPNFGEENAVKLVEQLCATYECEYEILPGKKLKFAKELSADKGHVYRYGVNVKQLTRNIDSTNIKTRIKGFGADGLIVEYISPQEDKLGKRVAEPIHDDRYLHADSLRERLRMELQDYPLINFETDVIDLTTRELGETVTLVYEPMDNLVIKTRVIEQNYIYKRGKWRVDKVTLGNYKQQSNVDILVSTKLDLDDNKKHTTSRFEQTNDLIHMSVETLNESIAQVNIRADSIEASVRNVRGQVATLEIRADKIESRVTDEVNGLNSKIEQTASSITSTVEAIYKDLDGKITTNRSEIKQLDDEISMKVDVNGVISAINLSDEGVKIKGKNIDLEGTVTVLSDISGKLGDIYSGNIDISEDVTIGKNLTFKVGGRNFITFADQTYIGSDGSGGLLLTALNDLDIDAYSINFNNARIRNLNISGYAKGHTDGIGIAYSEGANRLYVRIDGSNVGYIDLM